MENLQIFNIAIVAGESSGDLLGAELISAIKAKIEKHNQQNSPKIQVNFLGIGGDEMSIAGCKNLFSYEDLAVMGYIDALKNLRKIYKIRQKFKNFVLQQNPKTALFIGIDAPDFNLDLEKYFKNKNIKTIHYVSPSVWAWRKKRIYKIKKAVDEILLLFPHEQKIYEEIGVKATFVGHSLADNIDSDYQNNEKIARKKLHLTNEFQEKFTKENLEELENLDISTIPEIKENSENLENSADSADSADSKKTEFIDKDATPFPVFALLPGSRVGEIQKMAQTFLETAESILQYQNFENSKFLLPIANKQCKTILYEQVLPKFDKLINNKHLMILHGHADLALAAADVSLVASGTATLQAALYKKPLVVAYKISPLMFWFAKKLVKIPYISLPNVLCNEQVVPEFLQDDMTCQNLTNAMLELYMDNENKKLLVEKFSELHTKLKQNAAEKSAERIWEYLKIPK